jgi:hypothetical protein
MAQRKTAKSNYWRAPSKETEKLVQAERRRGLSPLPPEICSAIRRFVREELGYARFTMHLVDDGGTRNYTSYGVLPLSSKANASKHFEIQWLFMQNSKDVDEK